MESSSTKGNIRHGKLKSQKELKKITDSEEYKKSDYEGKTKKLNVATANKGMSVGQAKIAAKAPPPNKIDAKDFAVLRQEKAKGRGMGLQDEKVQPGKVMKAKRGTFLERRLLLGGIKPKEVAKSLSKTRGGKSVTRIPLAGKSTSVGSTTMKGMKFSDKAKMVDAGKINKATGKFTSMEALRESVGYRPGESTSEFKKRRMKTAGAMKALKASRVGKIALGVAAAGVAASQYLKGKMKKDKNKKTLKDFREQKKPGVPSEKTKTINSALNKLSKKMGGGMMNKPMSYNTGGPSAGFKSKQDRKKAEKNIKQARSKEGLRSFLSSGNKINQPMRKERYMEGRKARHTEFKKKIGRTALGIASSLNPITSMARGIGKVMGKGSKKRDFQKGDYGDISVKKNMGGMMMQRPMGYKQGTKPGAGPLGGIGQAGRKAGTPAAGRPTQRPASQSKEISADNKRRIAYMDGAKETVTGGGMKADRFKEGLNIKGRKSSAMKFYARGDTDHGKLGQKKYKSLKNNTYSKGGMMKPMGYRSGTMVKARGCKLGRTRPTKIT